MVTKIAGKWMLLPTHLLAVLPIDHPFQSWFRLITRWGPKTFEHFLWSSRPKWTQKTHAEQTSNHGCRVFNFAPGPYPSYPSMQRQSFVTFALCTQRVTHVLWKSVDERCVFYGRQIIFRAMDMSKLGTNTFGDPFTAEWGYWSCRWRFLWYYCIIIYNVYIYRYTHICIIYFLFTHTIRIQTSIYRGLHGPSRTREMLPGRRHLHAWLFLATVAIATRNHTVSKIAYIFAWFTVLDLLQGMVGDPDSEKWRPIPKNERVCLGSAIAT